MGEMTEPAGGQETYLCDNATKKPVLGGSMNKGVAPELSPIL